MTLATQTVAFPFTQGLDTKSDPKAIPIGKFSELENAVFTNIGILSKRNGYDILPRTIEGSASSISAAQAIATYGDELILFSGTRVYSYSTSTAHWQDRGAATPVSTATYPIIRNTYQQSNADCAEVGGVRLTAWEDSRGGVRYSVQDATTGAFYVSDQSANATATKPKCVAFNGELVLFYANGANLNYRRIPATQPSTVGAEVNIISTLVALANHYDVVVADTRMFIAWNSQTGTVAQVQVCDTSYVLGAIASLIGPATNCIGVVTYNTNSNVAVLFADNTQLRIRGFTFTLALATSTDTIEAIANIAHATAVVTSGTSMSIFYDITDVATNSSDKQYTKKGTWDTYSGATSAAVLVRSVGIQSKAFAYGGIAYLWTTHGSTYQNTYYLVDGNGRVVSKANPGTGGGLRSNALCAETPSPSTGIYDCALMQASRLVASAGNLYTLKGCGVERIDFVSNKTFASARVGRNLIVTGGLVQMYDGASVVEQGFLQYPETLGLATPTALTCVVTTPGSGGAAEVTDITPPTGASFGPGQYFNLYSATDAIHYLVWFTVDGYGTAPTTGGVTLIPCAILSADTVAQITAKMRTAILAVASASFTVVDGGTKITTTNTANGATTDASNAAAPDGVGTGAVAAGTYQYVAIYEWTDNAGQVHRSPTSLPASVTLGAPNGVVVTIPTLRLSLKSDVRIAIYRTVTLGSIFYRLTALSQPRLNSATVDSVTFLDVSTDAQILGNEILYTTGGVLDNFSPPSASLMASYRSRAFLAGLADKNQIAYSTETLPGEPVAFSEAFTIACDARGGNITALGVLDDKLIIFKESAIFALAGDGPTAAGAQNDYGDPQLIASDAGCNNPNSVVITTDGLLFQSAKGTMKLDRSLQCQYVGADVEAFNSVPVTGSVLVPNTNRIHFVTGGDKAIIYDYLFDQWSTWTNHAAADCDVWQGKFVFVRPTGEVYVEHAGQFTDGGDRFVKMKVTTGWLSFADLQGFQRCRRLLVLGDYRGPHKLKVSIATDYSPAYTQVQVIDATALVGSSVYGSDPLYGVSSTYGGTFTPYQFELHMQHQKSQAFRVSIEDYQSSGYNEGCALNGLTFEVGVKGKTGPKQVPAARSF